MNASLEDCLVIDLSRLFPGPYCSMILADHGARVIAVEDRRYEAEAMPVLSHINRNKEHMTLNLKTEKGKAIFFALVKKADVILEGFRPGVTDRLGVGYDAVNQFKPDIVYCALTGYGQSGPLKDQPGHDVNYLGHSGVLSVNGPKNGIPCIPGIQIADMVGGLNAAIGIMLALYAREKTGRGQYIDISMTDAMLAMLPVVAGWHWVFGSPPKRGDALLSHRYACYNVYETKDNKYVTLGALEPRFWEPVCRFFEKPEFIPLQYDENSRETLLTFFRQAFMKKTRDQWMAAFEELNTCFGRVLAVDEALDSEQARDREMAVEHQHPETGPVSMLGIPVKLSETPGAIRSLPPKFGAHTRPILLELGYSDQQIRDLIEEGIV